MSTTVHILGNVAQQPELTEVRMAQGLTHKLRICIASNPSRKKDNLCATFTDCEIWGRRAAALADHVGKGDRLYIVGELMTQTWTNKEGEQKKKQIVNIDRLDFAGGTRVDSAFDQSPKAKTVQQPAQAAPVFDENIPF
jgi:single-strand DNA-binding protein